MTDISAREVDFKACELSAHFLDVLQRYLQNPKKRREISRLTSIPEKTLVDYQNGRTSPSVDRFLLIAVACNTPPADFFPGEDDPVLSVSSEISSFYDIPRGPLHNRASLMGEMIARFLRDALQGVAQRKEISRKTGLSENTLKDYFTGRAPIRVDHFISIAFAVGQSPSTVMRAEPEASALPPSKSAGTVAIPVLDVFASAGLGALADVVRAEAEFEFPIFFLEKLMGQAAYSARLESLRAKGDSMAPTILNDALLIVDRNQATLPDPDYRTAQGKQLTASSNIYVFFDNGELRLKRLIRVDHDHVAIFSDNLGDYPIEMFDFRTSGSLKIIGKIIWWDNRL